MVSTFSWVGLVRDGTTASKMAENRLACGCWRKASGLRAVKAIIRSMAAVQSSEAVTPEG